MGNGCCSINKKLLGLRVTMFLFFGATSVLTPKLHLHMLFQGLALEEINVINAIVLVTSFLTPLVAGLYVDYSGKLKQTLITFIALNIIFYHLLYFTHARHTSHILPDQFIIKNLNGHYYTVESAPCNTGICPEYTELNYIIYECLDSCNSTEEYISNHTYTHFNMREEQSGFLSIKINNESVNDPPIHMCSIYSRKHQNITYDMIPACLRDCKIERMDYEMCASVSVNNFDIIFWVYLVVRICATIASLASLTLVDTAAFKMIEKFGGDFGKEKLYSVIGMWICTPFAWISISTDYVDRTELSWAFYIHALCLLMALIPISKMPLDENKAPNGIGIIFFKMVSNHRVYVTLVFLFFLGCFWGFFDNYMFEIILEENNESLAFTPAFFISLALVCPLVYHSGIILEFAGYINIMVFVFVLDAIQMFLLPLLEDWDWFPIMESMSSYFVWVLAVTYCAKLAPKGLISSMIGVIPMCYFCLGKGSGFLFREFFVKEINYVFIYCGVLALVVGAIYKLVDVFYLKKIEEQMQAEHDHLQQDYRELIAGDEDFTNNEVRIVNAEGTEQ